MLVVGPDPASRFLDSRQRLREVARNCQLDLERFRDRFQPVGGRLEWQRTGHDGFSIVFNNTRESLVDAGQLVLTDGISRSIVYDNSTLSSLL